MATPTEAEAPAARAPSGEGGFSLSPASRNYALGLLLLVFIFNHIDRHILAILLQPIKEDLSLSDTQLGFLSGIAFAIFYSSLGIPVALWADRGNRRNIIALAIALWSAMTILCGLAANYLQLVLARIGVGIGEAGSNPPSHSLIADYFPSEQRGRALSVLSLGVPVGILFSFLAGGWINEFFGWRTAFLVAGIPGLLIAVLVRLTLRELPRGYADGVTVQTPAPPFPEVLRFLWRQRAFRHITAALSLNAIVIYGALQWIPAFLARSHDMTSSEIGTAIAIEAGILGGIGTYFSGVFADRWGTRDRRWYVWLPALSIVLALPCALGLYLWPGIWGALAFGAAMFFLGNMYLGPSFSMIQGLAKPQMRAVAASIMLFVANLIGLGLGPQFVGIASDLLRPEFGEDSLRYALVLLTFTSIWGAYHYHHASRTLRNDLLLSSAPASQP